MLRYSITCFDDIWRFFYCSGARTTQFWTCHWWTSQIFIFKFAWKETYMTWVSSKAGGMPMAFLDLFFFPWYSQTNPLPPRTVGVILNSSVFQGKISKIGELSHCFQLRGPGPGARGLQDTAWAAEAFASFRCAGAGAAWESSLEMWHESHVDDQCARKHVRNKKATMINNHNINTTYYIYIYTMSNIYIYIHVKMNNILCLALTYHQLIPTRNWRRRPDPVARRGLARRDPGRGISLKKGRDTWINQVESIVVLYSDNIVTI